MQKARLLLLDVIDGGGFKEVICGCLQDYYNNLKCNCFDIVRTTIGDSDTIYDIFVDDCGLFAEEPIVSAINKNREPVLVGNLVFALHDRHGNTISLTDQDIKYIQDYAMTIIDTNCNPPKVYTAMQGLDYGCQ